MAKNFAPRTSKKKRQYLSLDDKINPDVFRGSDEKLLQGARLQNIRLSEIKVKEQVRTKFNDDSLKDLAENIKVNGLIQPIVIHREGERSYLLICGERRYRAMNLIDMKEAPCFILENKTAEELMAIQFSENSSREDLHYIDKAEGIQNYKAATGASERKIQAALAISKTEVHRGLLLAQLPRGLKEAAKKFNVEKYVLLEFLELEDGSGKDKIADQVGAGKITKRTELKKAMKVYKVRKARVKKVQKAEISADNPPEIKHLVKSLGDMKKQNVSIDDETRELLKEILRQEAQEDQSPPPTP